MARAVVYDEIGGPEVLRLAEQIDEPPGEGRVVVRVRAAGINPYDIKVRSGFILSKAPFPRRLGADLAGTVEQVGNGAVYWDGTPVAVGDEVLGSGAGSFAERVTTSAANLVRRPAALPLEVAGSLRVPGQTAVSCLRTVPVGPGDTVLVGGATGSVGMLVCQLAVEAGATVLGTAEARNHDFVRSLGVEPVSYGVGLAERLAKRVDGGGEITAVIDCHGREALDAGVALGIPRERIVAIAGYGAVEELGILNVERESRTAENLAGLAEAVAEERLLLPVVQTFPLDEVVAAFKAAEKQHAPGKIVVMP
ncbi:MAG TPA: NADP-dependent oxidoreductase [Actinomycetaceae bacterium]|nr:NADP-dependent oxidoreductase [Actinomycetaceae bacterium]